MYRGEEQPPVPIGQLTLFPAMPYRAPYQPDTETLIRQNDQQRQMAAAQNLSSLMQGSQVLPQAEPLPIYRPDDPNLPKLF